MLLSIDESLNAAGPRSGLGAGSGAGEHISVLLEASMKYLHPERGGLFLDGTFGGGGHTRALLEGSPEVCVLAIDQDPEAKARAAAFKSAYGERFQFHAMNFAQIKELKETNFDGILFDFGLSSFQLDQGERGFSFRYDAPLDMRMNNTSGITAHEFLETADEASLHCAIRDYGEEPAWRRVSEAIIKARGTGALSRTQSFAALIESVVPKRGHTGFAPRIHPATRSFQGVRIAINDELKAIERGLSDGFECLKAGGVLVAISFHSLEDRIVKRLFRRLSGRPEHRKDNRLQSERRAVAAMIETKAVKASAEEIALNPRSRSARMRGIIKLEGAISV